LLDIRYLGFRGEALPSIGSISRLTVTSRNASAANAWSLHVEGGQVGDIQPAVLTQGTRVEVCDLFYATPARLKFLKTDRTEVQQTVDIITRLAMVHPDIAFSLTSDDKSIFRVDAQGDLLDGSIKRLRDIMGKEFSDNALALDTQRETLRLTGFASLPTFNRGTSTEQYLYVINYCSALSAVRIRMCWRMTATRS
jgi:DNA mismatch repair protein MutL